MGSSVNIAGPGQHVFVVIEGKKIPSGLKWSALRASAVSSGGFLSLALVNGAQSTWIVRPSTSPDHIPDKVFTAGSDQSRPGAARKIVDQVMESTAIIQSIRTTEIRLFGGASFEGELHDALAGAPNVTLKVASGSTLRDSRSSTTTNKTRLAVTTKKAPAPTPAPQPKSAAPSTRPTPSPSPDASSSATVELSRRVSFGRRFTAALLTTVLVLTGVFSGWVWSKIWSDFENRDSAETFVLIAQTQSRAFGLAVVVGFATLMLGRRAQAFGAGGLVLGAIVGIWPSSIPSFLIIEVADRLNTLFAAVAGFWGSWIWAAPILALVIAFWLAAIVAVLLDPDETFD